MNQATENALTNQLLRQRAILVGEVADAETDLLFIAEDRETDFEEHAQEERAAHLLAQLDEQGKRQIEEIDAALRRMAEGTYGTCDGCTAPIPNERLRALPATRFCVDCAHAQELLRPIMAGEEAISHPGPVPPDLGLLSDRERQEEIRERVRNDGRVDLEELRIVYRHGVVHLDGALPSEREHSILRHVLTDECGVEELVDHIQVKAGVWEREDRTKVAPLARQMPGEEPYGTENIVESLEEGLDYVPPVSPTADEE
jgi:RNA polymerase-binding protein DksA